MAGKVSVIIPNYNSENFLIRCLDSVYEQKYPCIEVIIVDDGSTDESWKIIKHYQQKHTDLQIYHQENMNASIARNKGMEIATGIYYLFLDSDDMLCPNAIINMVEYIEKTKSDLVIGNYCKIDENNNIIGYEKFSDTDKIYENAFDLVGLSPVPSNKLYRADVIKENGVLFGNVKIGQDLNFYLKYLLCCKKIAFIPENIYYWRVMQGSMTHTYSFRIFDIVESFANIKSFYKKHTAEELYERYVKMMEFTHYYIQMSKQIYFTSRQERKIVVEYFSYFIKQLDVKNCKNYKENISTYKKCRWKLRLGIFYQSNLCIRMIKFLKEKIQG